MITNRLTYRTATLDDIDFLVDTIIEAEKSGTNILTYSTIFGISEQETRVCLREMLAQEVHGCELSISSFYVAETENKSIAGAVAAWIEGANGTPSAVLKGNLLNYVLPKDALKRALPLNNMVREMHIEYKPNTIQIGLVYISPSHRGESLASLLIDDQINNMLKNEGNIEEAFVQVFGNNHSAIHAYEKVNFRKVSVKESSIGNILEYMPSNTKILMRRELKTLHGEGNGKNNNF
jgi:ribosomal protein S18 acetylase RimI-like enzyme